MSEQLVELVRRTRARIEDPKHWTQGCNARNAYGSHTGYDFDDAVCWCMWGGFLLELDLMKSSVEKSKLCIEFDSTFRNQLDVPLSIYNDTHTHAEVLGALDQFIAKNGG